MARKRSRAGRDSKGRFVKRAAARRNPVRRHRRRTVAAAPVRRRRRSVARRNVYLANPRRRHVRRYRRNPPMLSGGKIFGVSFIEYAYAGGAFVAVPAIESLIKDNLPTSITSTPIGKYGVKVGLGAGLAFLAGKFISHEAGKAVAIGAGLYVLANAVVDFMPQVFSGFSGYLPGPRSVRGQRMLGAYTRGQIGAGMTQAGVPERLSIASRF